MNDPQLWQELAQQLRVDAVRASSAAGSGHPTSALSAADLMAVLLADHLRYDFDAPDDPGNDHLVFSKGHATPLLYAMWKAAGAITDEELLTYRKLGSRLQGHPTPAAPWVQVATGSLGQGLPVGVGLALAAARLDQLPSRVWVLCGDSEMAEGSMWEAFEHAGYEGLDQLTAVIDVNRLGQRGPTRHGWDLDAYARRARAFGWHAIEIEGHDLAAIDRAYAEAVATEGRPTVIVARTEKGHGVRDLADRENRHGKVVPDEAAALEELGGPRQLTVQVGAPRSTDTPRSFDVPGGSLPTWELGAKVATRQAYGEALAALGRMRGDVVVLDGEVGNSTMTEIFGDEHPDRFFQMYIAEQQLVAAAVGMQIRGWAPFAASFAAFLSRAYDFIRMAAVSQADLRLCGSHAGVSIGEDGPSQMGLEDVASLRAVHGSTVLYPCDANQTAKLVELTADLRGVSYLRTTRGGTPVIYGPDERFEVGGSRVLRQGDDDRVTIVAAGITLHEALAAADRLAADGIAARVVDCYSVKPIDAATLRSSAAATRGRVLTVEDHWAEGGLGDAVLDALAGEGLALRLEKLAVRGMPGSATPAEELREAGIDADAIVAACRRLAG